MMHRAVLHVLAALAGALPAAASAPPAWTALERICQARAYDKPLDYAAVAVGSGWADLGDAHTGQAVALLASLRTLEHPFLDVRTAQVDAIAAAFRDIQVQVLADLATGLIGVLTLDTPHFVAFAPFRVSETSPTPPCEIHVIGRAEFLDDRFTAPGWETVRRPDAEMAMRLADGANDVVYRDITYAKAAREAGLTLPDYTVHATGADR